MINLAHLARHLCFCLNLFLFDFFATTHLNSIMFESSDNAKQVISLSMPIWALVKAANERLTFKC